MNPFYKIAIDRVNAKYLSGWCYRRFRPGRPVRLSCFLDGRLVAETTADRFREDLKALGFHTTGHCGFEMILDQHRELPAGAVVELRAAESLLPLLRISTATGRPVGMAAIITRLRNRLRSGRNERTILFMHIPKTAGTSFVTWLQAALPKDRGAAHIELLEMARFRSLPDEYRYLAGHLPVGTWKRCFNLEKADLLTIVREPYAHLHSHLSWLMQTARTPEDNYFRMHNPAIIELGHRLSEIDMTSPAALATFVADLDHLQAAFLDNMQTRYFLDSLPPRVDHRDLRQALANLDHFSLIGLTERYREFLEQFGQRYRISPVPENSRLNRSAAPPLFDIAHPDNRAALLPLVRYDLELYRHLQNRL